LSTVAFIRRCMDAGMDWETALLAAEQFEAAPQPMVPAVTARQARNARYYEKQKAERLKASETSETKTPKTVSDDLKTVKTVSDADPRARVRELSPRLVISGSDDADDARALDQPSDDWPAGSAKDHAKALIAEVGSAWLDPNKSLDLNTTMGRLAAWKREGASWTHDVVPTVAKLCERNRKPVKSWKFFDGAIAQAIADNRAALSIPEARVVPLRPGGFKSRDDLNTEAWDYAIARIAQDEQ